MPAFKIWNVDRSKKYSIFIKEKEEIYQALISKASQKFQIEGTALVLESDGTVVDEDEAVIFYEKEIFILLSKNKKWIPASTPTPSESSTVGSYIVSEHGELLKEKDFTDAPTYDDFTDASTRDGFNDVATHNGSTNAPTHDGSTDAPTYEPSNNLQTTNYEIIWKDFQIPFEIFTNDVKEEIDKPVLLKILETDDEAAKTWLERRRRIQTQVVHTIVDEMRNIKTKIPMSAFKIIANKLRERYPIFEDIDSNNVVIENGCFTLTMKLIERNNYLNRPFKRKSTTAGKIPRKQSKKMANITSGCSNWDPQPNEAILDKENLKISLNTINETDENFYKHLKDSYSTIRMAINNNESLKQILNQWPILQKLKNAFYWHFKNLTKVDLTMLEIKIYSKANKIIEFGIKNKLHHSNDDIKVELAVLQIFSKYFKEDITQFIFEVKEESLEEVVHSLEIYSPYIIKINKENHKEYKVVIEKNVFNSVDTFNAALEMAFGAFYIFNLEYPKNICATLEMIQRYFLKIHPDSGSRSKKQGATKKKVIGLMSKLFF